MDNKELKLKSYPKYLRLRDKLKERIVNEEFSPGDKLPTERELALNYNVGRMVIRKALDELAKNGALVRFRGRGTYLNPDLQETKFLKAAQKPLGFLFISKIEGTQYLKDYIIHYLSSELEKQNSHLVFMSIPESVSIWEELPAPIRNGSIAGLFLMGNFTLETVNMISEKIPAMLLGKHLQGANASSIVTDNIAGIRIAFEHLHNLGHRRIGYFGGPVSHSTYRERLNGYKQALEEHNMIFNDEIAHICPKFGEIPEEKIYSSLRKVSAFICDSESKAARLVNTLQKEGIQIPEDISIVAFGNTPLAFLTTPQLITVSYDGSEFALLAVRYLSGEMKRINTRLLVSVKLVERDSTAPPLKTKKRKKS